jgi:1-acyl-sn-glycerol-3-phosphate acyltransferase
MLNFTIKSATRLLCQVDDEELQKIPNHGPLIIVTNHINFLDAPILYTHLLPRPITGLAKIETWENPVMGKLFDMWGAIPLKRGEPDRKALQSMLSALKSGMIIGIAPEGTRSESGILGSGHPGVVSIALHSRAPLLPIGFYGGEQFKSNIRQLRRTDFHIRVGTPFYLNVANNKTTRDLRRMMVDEIMYQIAKLLPVQYRGQYNCLENAVEAHLKFISLNDLQAVTIKD